MKPTELDYIMAIWEYIGEGLTDAEIIENMKSIFSLPSGLILTYIKVAKQSY